MRLEQLLNEALGLNLQMQLCFDPFRNRSVRSTKDLLDVMSSVHNHPF